MKIKLGLMAGVLGTLCVLLILAAIMRPAGDAGAATDSTRVVAHVNDQVITVDRFNKSYVRYLIRSGWNDTPGNRYTHLNRLIETYLLAEEARRKGLDEDAEYQAYVDRQAKLAVGGRYFEVAFADALPPLSDAEIREAFRRSKEKVALRHLFFRDPKRAQAAYERLEAGADFVLLANEVFETNTLDTLAGYLGFTTYWDLDDAVAEAAFSLPVGTYSQPVRSRFGWHILRVEERLTNPLLTESEFQYRRDGIVAKARIQRNRLAGDRYVRELMEGLDVQVDPEGARLVVEAVERVLQDAAEEERPRVALRDEEVEAIEQRLTPETVLLTYTFDEVPQAFTALDYYRWLPELPYAEIRNRAMASVGRALRNEVLARYGLEMSLADDPEVQETVQHVSNAFLADRMRTYQREHEPIEPTDEDIERAYERYGYRELREARADFWQIGFSSLKEAEGAKAALDAGKRSPEQFETYTSFVDQDLETIELGDQVRRTPIRERVILCTDASSCYVLYVEDRTLRYATLEEREDEIREQLERLLPEAKLLDRLYERADVVVDTLLFEQMMEL